MPPELQALIHPTRDDIHFEGVVLEEHKEVMSDVDEVRNNGNDYDYYAEDNDGEDDDDSDEDYVE